MKENRYRLDMGKMFLTVSVEGLWHGLSREAVDAHSWKFKARLDGARSNLGLWKVFLSIAGVRNKASLKSLST